MPVKKLLKAQRQGTQLKYKNGKEIPEHVRKDERTRIKEILREYCDSEGKPYEELLPDQAIDALKYSDKISTRQKLYGLIQRWWGHGTSLGDIMKMIAQEVQEETAGERCKAACKD